MSTDDNHADAIAYRYRGVHVAPETAALSTAELVARIDAETVPLFDWEAHAVIAERSGIAHEFEAGYSHDLEERYKAVRLANPDADPRETGGAFDDAYDAYADAHEEILVPTARALAWGRAHA